MSEKRLMLWALVVLLLGSAAVLCQPEPRRWSCGHWAEPAWKKWLPLPRASHCCYGGRLASELYDLDIRQRLYENDHGRFATNLETLIAEQGFRSRFSLQFSSDGTNWSCAVAKQDALPGYYLWQNRTLYFHEDRPATTNDLVLRRWWDTVLKPHKQPVCRPSKIRNQRLPPPHRGASGERPFGRRS